MCMLVLQPPTNGRLQMVHFAVQLRQHAQLGLRFCMLSQQARMLRQHLILHSDRWAGTKQIGPHL